MSFADDGVGWVVFHFGCDPALMNESNESKGNSSSETLKGSSGRENVFAAWLKTGS